MNASLETKAFGLALLAAAISLSGALLSGASITMVMNSGTNQGRIAAPSPEPAVTPALIEQGHQFFTMSCSECHGDDAHGDEGPDLHNLAISNSRIGTTIKKGVKGEMPTFGKKYNDVQVAALVAYLRTLH